MGQIQLTVSASNKHLIGMNLFITRKIPWVKTFVRNAKNCIKEMTSEQRGA